ncbi:NACHT, LRR and PYD domains-containing protein 12-like, partial [Electrophorus electricus]|uniref:NACHT, LRR and PYD domains-containing protein 12-like n=1 Tax=Electrophorus electricus TaxID=8005 RepID=UPI0015CFF60B
MKSDRSMDYPPAFNSGPVTSVQWRWRHSTAIPVPSCVSMKSDQSMEPPPNFSSGPVTSVLRDQKKPVNISKEKLESVFKELEDKIISLLKNELKRFKNLLSSDYPACTERQVEDEEDHSSVREGTLTITLHVLRKMNQKDLANTLLTKLAPACHRKLKSKLRDKCQKIHEGISQQGTTALLNEIYTELYITEGGSGEVNNEHEVRQIETASRRTATQETSIKCSDIFRPLPGQDKALRTVLTKGVAGIGKTVSVQKFILDWSEGNINQDVLFIFPLPFRELNLLKEKKFSLVELLHRFFPETCELKPKHYTSYKILFIFDGLDECRLPLDFQNNERLWDVTESTSTDVLLTNLIKGNLLPSALLWITSRPAAANQIPPECVDQVTEVRGFSEPQKEEYFRKRISDQVLANRIITHMKSSKSLYIMCHIPVFCCIAATVLERMLGEAESGEIPKTLTQMFTHFLIFQLRHKDQKYGGSMKGQKRTHTNHMKKHVLALGKLAFQQLEKGNLIFYEEDLRNSGIDVREMTVYSGMCTQIFREEFELQLGKAFSFVHLSVQEFLAALYVFISFISTNTNLLQQKHAGFFSIFKTPISVFLNSAVDKALQSQNGHLDLFLRFLLGLSLESNQTLLQGLLTQTGNSSPSKEETVKYIKEKISENPSTEKSINLFHCLNELNDHSLVQEVQTYLNRGANRHRARLSPAQWSALVFVLLNSEEELDEFDLRKYDPSEECLLRLLPVVKASRKAILSGCGLTEESCKSLTSVLQTENSLRELEMNNNYLQNSGVEQLCAGLKSSHCKLEILRLSGCLVTGEGCSSLASALRSNPSHLKELDLTYNHPEESGVKLLSARLEDPNCRLDTLRLSGCNLTEGSCKSLTTVLQTENTLRELEMNNNDLQNSGVEQLCAGLKSSHCKLDILRLSGCGLTEESCKSLTSVLQTENSLRELEMNNNDLQNSGVEQLCAGLKSSHCKLEILRLSGCGLTEGSCKSLTSVLQTENSLRELEMNNNDLQNSGVEQLCAGLKSSHCKLEILRLSGCGLTEGSCKSLTSVLQTENSLRELEMNNNDLQNSGVEQLCAGLKSSHCKLEILRLSGCLVTEEGCSSLASALRSNPSHLKELDLTYNHPGESGVKLLSARLEDPHCRLDTLRVEHAGEMRIKPGLRKYACDLTLDPNTAHTRLSLSEGNRKVTCVEQQQSYPDHAERFDVCEQVVCRESLTGRCYWEVEWSGRGADISVTYKGISRKGGSGDCVFGCNLKSWSLSCSDNSYTVWHNNKFTDISAPSSSNRVGVYLDWPAGTLSFYSVSSHTHTLTHLHTLHSTFTEPLYAGFWLYSDS